MSTEKREPWMVLDQRLIDLENLVKTLNALADHIYDRDDALGVVLFSPLDELDHIQKDLRGAFEAYHNANKEEKGETRQ